MREAEVPTAATLPLPVAGTPPHPRVPLPVRATLGNGLRVLLVERTGVPQVAIRLVVPAGAAGDPPVREGTAALVGALLTEGTAALDAITLNARLDHLGAAINVQVGHDFAEVDLSTLSDTLEPALDLLAEVVLRPSFPGTELERVRAETLDALEARGDEPANVADDRAALELFGPEHPYGRLTSGTPPAVAAIRREEIVAFHSARYRPDAAVLVAAGDFSAETLLARLQVLFSSWSGSAERIRYPVSTRAPQAAGSFIRTPFEEAAQAEIRFAGVGLERSSPLWITAAVANYLLGGSTITGRLGANLREDKGWTYGVRSGFSPAVRPGGWSIETAVDVEVAEAAVAEIVGELRRFCAASLSEDELRRAKDALILSLPRAFETAARIVSRLATLEAFGLEPDYWERFPQRVEAVTAAEIQSLARRCFDPARLVALVVGPPGGERVVPFS